ncbi:DUF1707 SHOCT-like domain-containing protein [Asanoa iriomotensis]|uniref:DUF1707 domain-containing protein n=1 Tax=Asanoa iriomotensis TaxID=234613 RepID=A0ABQ4C1S3_9ACTN|nr:DUF1707 domain-containing protein [Asanoa iriomotensis]GIF56728.1 hypothetical protein Air01nite_28230 [Asanoa iriomotensis]
MTAELPSQRDIRMSDAERESVLARLNTAVSEGRLTMAEFEERVDGVLRSRTFRDVEPFLADLPRVAVVPAMEAKDVVELRGHAGQIRRSGRWAVPRKLVVRGVAGIVKLDFREAVFSHRFVEVELSTQGGTTFIVLPRGATADLDKLRTTGGFTLCRVNSYPDPASTAPHLVVTGSSAAGTLIVRYPRKLGRWTW